MTAVWSNKCCEESKEKWENRHRGDTFGSYFHVTAGSSSSCQDSELCCFLFRRPVGKDCRDIRMKEILGTVLKLQDLSYS